MVKGRKPAASSIRRRKKTAPKEPVSIEVEAIPVSQLEKTELCKSNPIMSNTWDLIVGDGSTYTPIDAPQIEMFCYWYAVSMQCVANTITKSGTIVTTVAREKSDGTIDMSTAKINPDIRTAKIAADTCRQLAAELGISPLARQRMGLITAVTQSTQADLVKKTELLYERYKGINETN